MIENYFDCIQTTLDNDLIIDDRDLKTLDRLLEFVMYPSERNGMFLQPIYYSNRILLSPTTFVPVIWLYLKRLSRLDGIQTISKTISHPFVPVRYVLEFASEKGKRVIRDDDDAEDKVYLNYCCSVEHDITYDDETSCAVPVESIEADKLDIISTDNLRPLLRLSENIAQDFNDRTLYELARGWQESTGKRITPVSAMKGFYGGPALREYIVTQGMIKKFGDRNNDRQNYKSWNGSKVD